MTDVSLPPDLASLMSSWGGFDAPAGPTGPEKRLELDLRASNKVTLKSLQVVTSAVTEALDVTEISRREADAAITIICESAIVIATSSRVVITTNSDIELDASTASVVAAITELGIEVEWASYMHKMNTSPWETSDSTMAHEYKGLKTVFPSGSPFIFGSLDSDYYFYFVYDAVNRATVVDESDFQLNIKMYNTDAAAASASVFSAAADVHAAVSKEQQFQGCAVLPSGCHESMRVRNGGQYACFETTEEAALDGDRVKEMLATFKPDRFTIVVLVDPKCATSQKLAKKESIGVEADNFSDYSLLNRTVNEFAPGYVMVQMSYTR